MKELFLTSVVAGITFCCTLVWIGNANFHKGYTQAHEAWTQRTNQNWKEFAVAEGKAEYYLDKNNQRQWRWKELEFTP